MGIQGFRDLPDLGLLGGIACGSCGTHADLDGVCLSCGVLLESPEELHCGVDEEVGRIDEIGAQIDAIVKKEGFFVKLNGVLFSKIKINTEKGLARIYFDFHGVRRSVLVNPKLEKKIISKTGGFLSRDDFMALVGFINYLCNNQDSYDLRKYKAFQ